MPATCSCRNENTKPKPKTDEWEVSLTSTDKAGYDKVLTQPATEDAIDAMVGLYCETGLFDTHHLAAMVRRTLDGDSLKDFTALVEALVEE